MHVIAGGGGEFTHGTRVHRYPRGGEPACAFPDQAASRRLIIGYFLLSLVLSGLEHHQAFAVLGHPGFKHFVRLRVGGDGRIGAWVIGKATRWATARRRSSTGSAGNGADGDHAAAANVPRGAVA